MSRLIALCLPAALATVAAATTAAAEPAAWGMNSYGIPGLVDMPQAMPAGDGDLAFTTSHFVNQTRNTLSFQISPRLTGAFRYSLLYGIDRYENGVIYPYIFDRSFSLQFLIAPESRHFPALAIGLNDFLGTGIYASEYLVATRSLGDRLRLSAGIGWGRLAGVGSFDNPLSFFGEEWETRIPRQSGTNMGGLLESQAWFHGPAALFGGVEWRPDDNWTLIAEYSSDAYPYESPAVFERRSPLNLGLRYRLGDHWTLGAQYLHGSELGVQVTWAMNPDRPPHPSGLEPMPPLVQARDPGAAASRDATPDATARLAAQARAALTAQGLTLHGLAVTGDEARIEIENDSYPAAAQAIGRAARALSGILPAQVGTFRIVIVESGMPAAEAVLSRGDLEELEFAFDGAWQMQARSSVGDPGSGTDPLPGLFPRFSWGIDPYLAPALFDPDAPLRADLGIDVSAAWEVRPGLVFSGILRQPILGNLDESTRESTSVLPHVRSDGWLYDKADTQLSRLTGAWYFRPGGDLFGRVTAGLLEPMFAGVSAEVLWYPIDSRIALGAEIAHVVQRDYDQGFGLLDYEVTTGHLSGYWDIGGGYQAQLDLGRYLAGDWGATLSLDRRFDNGWSVGAFATLTDVPFGDFGEGSFDKGIRITMPIGWIGGQATRDARTLVIHPVQRDGGARLDVDGRLYEVLRPTHGGAIADGWARFWR
ncbi:MAG: YjbH domain-containing protein [Rubellimicrobium sp.]|nr:YjbH domain-containing protein [Rubellimicrobium sp.]